MKYILFTFDGSALSIAKKLTDEGNTVIVAQLQDVKELHCPGKTEEPEQKKKRLQLYDGILQKHEAKKVLRTMEKITNKDEWFVIFDLNSLWFYAQIALKMGFKNGFFPTEEDTMLEDDRESGKALVKKHYPDLEVAEVAEFKSAEDGIAYLEEHPDNIYVLKANTEGDLTVLPQSKDPELARETLQGALTMNKSEYESKGFILELRIENPIEITPQMVFYNGQPVFTDIDIENKPIGSGSIGSMTGCSGNLIIRTELDDEINRIAFPPIVHKMAKEHTGLFVWDASFLIDERTKQIYFGEFCPNRWGYDAIFTEITMAKSASKFFEDIVAGKNPLKKQFGVAVRMFNIKKFEEVPIALKDDKDIFVYDCYMKDDHMVSTGWEWNLLVATAADNDIETAIKKSYEVMEAVSYTDGYYRPAFDFISTEYQNSIPNRYNFANGWLFNAQEWGGEDIASKISEVVKTTIAKDRDKHVASRSASLKSDYDKQIQTLKEELASVKQEMTDILNS
jgi:hypothetical protein